MLPRLPRHCYCYADSRFNNPMVSGLAAYAMKRCSMKRKSIGCDIRSLSGFEKTRILEALSKSTLAKPRRTKQNRRSLDTSGVL